MLANLKLADLLYMVPVIILSFTIHEFSHAFMAVKFGDDTPRELGRYTLNPLRHISWIGLVLIVLFRFGWAKPVLINRSKLKNPKVDSILISIAGPVSNLLAAFLFCLFFRLCLALHVPAGTGFSIYVVINYFIFVNALMFIFNILPIPPLDGSHIVADLLPDSLEKVKINYLRYGNFLLLLLLVMNFTGFNVFGGLVYKTYLGITRLFGLV